MRFCLITFRSVTPAQRAERVLKEAKVDCMIQRTPRWMSEQGCGYSLRLRQNYAAQAAALLQKNNISYRKIYLHQENGAYEELTV